MVPTSGFGILSHIELRRGTVAFLGNKDRPIPKIMCYILFAPGFYLANPVISRSQLIKIYLHNSGIRDRLYPQIGANVWESIYVYIVHYC